jgi:MinD superfamily P-loop ATPase
MNVAVVSGKGGTGKSTLTSSLAIAMSKQMRIVLVDADSDCPNQHILFPGKRLEETPISVSKIALVKPEICSGCGKCADACSFGAVSLSGGVARIDGLSCEGCGACGIVCPENAIRLRPERSGKLIVTQTERFPLVYGRLLPGRSGTGKMVYQARKLAGQIADKNRAGLVLIDAPPGIGCPVIASITGCDYVVGVAEPTLAGIANLERALKVVEHFGIPHSVVMNKVGLSEKHERLAGRKFRERLLAGIPYDEEIPRLVAKGIPPIMGKGMGARALRSAAARVTELLLANR